MITKTSTLKTGSALVLAAISSIACVNVPTDKGFDAVAHNVSSRTGHHIAWHRGPRSPDVQDAIDAALKKPIKVNDAVRIALAVSPRMQANFEQLGIAQGELLEAGLLPNPVLNAGVFFPLDGGLTNLEVGLEQDLLSLFYRPLRQRVAHKNFEMTKAMVTREVVAFVARIREAFYRVQADQQLGEMLRQVVKTTDAAAAAASALYEAGNITKLDHDQERTLLEEAKLALLNAETQLAINRERLIRLMGLWGHRTEVKVDSRLPGIPDQVRPLADMEKRAVAASLDLKSLRLGIETQAARLNLANRSRLFPDLEAGPFAERDEGEWEVGPEIALPVPIFNRGQGRLRLAHARLRQLQQEYTATAIDIRSSAREARTQIHQSHAAARHVQAVLLPLRDDVLQETLLHYNAGQLGVFELLTAQRALIQTGQRYIDYLYQFWLARTRADALLAGAAVSLEQRAQPSLPDMNLNSGGH